MLENMVFHHIGVATKDLNKAMLVYKSLGFNLKDNQLFIDPTQKVQIGFMEKEGHPLIELIAPNKTGSPVEQIIKKSGAAPYHICYQVPDLKGTIKSLRKQNFIQIMTPVSATAFGGNDICFLYHKAIGLIEILQKK